MSIRDIITVPDETLKKISEPIEKVGVNERKLINDLFETMYNSNGIGLAAIQIGVPKRIIVMDISKNVEKKKIDILVGTQLLSKGFHFPKLNCIVVLDIDLTLNGHDLRVAEKNLQLYHQLSGRAGRAGKPATVYFQTYSNDTNSIKTLTDSDPDIFLSKELQLRRINNLPPFQRFISLILTGDNENKLEKEALRFKLFLENKISGKILGPVNAPIFRLKRKYRVRLLIRGLKTLKLQNSLAKLIPKYKFTSGIKLSVDVDPISFN